MRFMSIKQCHSVVSRLLQFIVGAASCIGLMSPAYASSWATDVDILNVRAYDSGNAYLAVANPLDLSGEACSDQHFIFIDVNAINYESLMSLLVSATVTKRKITINYGAPTVYGAYCTLTGVVVAP